MQIMQRLMPGELPNAKVGRWKWLIERAHFSMALAFLPKVEKNEKSAMLLISTLAPLNGRNKKHADLSGT